MKPIRIRNEEQFANLLDHLTLDAVRAADHWHLVGGIDGLIKRYEEELHQTPVFWNLTLTAHASVILTRLGRLYDQHPSAMSLGRFLVTIKSYTVYFEETSFRQRMRGIPNGEQLLERFEPLDLSTVDADSIAVSTDDDRVDRLVKLRNETLAHRSGELVRLADLTSIAGLGPADVEVLLKRAIALLQKYSMLYRRSFVSTKLVGGDDYEYLFTLLGRGFQAIRTEHNEILKAASGTTT